MSLACQVAVLTTWPGSISHLKRYKTPSLHWRQMKTCHWEGMPISCNCKALGNGNLSRHLSTAYMDGYPQGFKLAGFHLCPNVMKTLDLFASAMKKCDSGEVNSMRCINVWNFWKNPLIVAHPLRNGDWVSIGKDLRYSKCTHQLMRLDGMLWWYVFASHPPQTEVWVLFYGTIQNDWRCYMIGRQRPRRMAQMIFLQSNLIHGKIGSQYMDSALLAECQ